MNNQLTKKSKEIQDELDYRMTKRAEIAKKNDCCSWR